MAAKKVRMSGLQRREQLIEVARATFARLGFDATSMEEIASQADVSKPVVYEHFGSKEGLYAVIVDREVRLLTGKIADALQSSKSAHKTVENTTLALLGYIETNTDGFRILVRDSPESFTRGAYYSVIGDVANRVEHILAAQFETSGLDPKDAPLYAQALVGIIAQLGQWWLEERSPSKEVVGAHLVNLVWNGLHCLQPNPTL